jgi:hypothetical protein
MADKDDAPPSAALQVWHRAWRIAAVAFALLLNFACVGLLAYALVRLLA